MVAALSPGPLRAGAGARGDLEVPVRADPREAGQNTIELAGNELKPPSDGWITSFKPNLTYADGTVPRVDVIHLHHGVWVSNFEPLFAAGEEKTVIRRAPRLRLALPDQRPVAREPHDPQPHAAPADVYIEYELEFQPASAR